MLYLLKKSLSLVNICALAISLAILCFPAVAMADAENFTQKVEKTIMVQNGSFAVKVTGDVKESKMIRSVIVSLPDSETGTIENIAITGSGGQREFGCAGLQVKNGTDLIQECGGPAVLEAGKTTYEAKGIDFAPNPDVPFSVDLIF